MTRSLRDVIAIDLPILQAPMAGVSTPDLAAAVSKAGALGALGLGASSVEAARQAIVQTRDRTGAAFNVNFFCHAPPLRDARIEQAWIDRARPVFAGFDAVPPTALHQIYDSFRDNDDLLRLVLDLRPAVASFHFGLPRPAQITAMKQAGIVLLASATSVAEARQIAAAGLDAVVAQGWQAGGHRGMFDPDADDGRLATLELTRRLVRDGALPVIAAGGLMDGRDIRDALDQGAVAAQLGTAFILCPESAADAAYRARLGQGGDTRMTRAISGRPARCLVNRFTEWAKDAAPGQVPAYPCAYDLGKALNAAARARGEPGFGAQWSGTEAGRARTLPAADLVALLAAELRQAG